MGSQPDAEQAVERTTRGLLTAATDGRGLRVPIQAAILIGYAGLAVLSSLTITGSVSWIAIAVVAPFAWAAQWGAIWLVHRGFLGRPWWHRHGFWSSMVLMLIIAVISVLTAGILGSAAATDGWTVLWRWGITVLVTSIAVLSIDYGRDVQEERDLQERLQDARLHGVEQVIAQRGDVVSRMLAMLQDAVASVAGSSAHASEVITGFAREQVRPLSHELMQALPAVDAPRARSDSTSGWRDVLARITSVPLIRPTLMAIAVTLLFLFTTVETTTAGDPAPGRDPNSGAGVTVSFDLASFAVTLFLLAVVFVVTWGTAWVMLRLTRDVVRRASLGRRVLVVLLTPIVIAVVLAVVIQLAYVVPGLTDELSSNLADRLWLTAPIVIVAFAILIGRVLVEAITTTRRQLRRSTADLEWENTRVRNALDQERQFFATQLHGPIQSAAAAAALRLQSLGADADPDPVLTDVARDLTLAIHALAEGPPQRRELRAEMSNLVSTWTGVCAVHIDLPESIVEAFDSDWVACGTVVDLLVDAAANAAMHGRAENVWISATWLTDDEVGITIANDGSTDLADGRGLGSTLLDESCIRWSRGIVDGAVVLSFTIATPKTAAGTSTSLSSV